MAAWRASASSFAMRPAYGSIRCPAGVRLTPRVCRTKSGTPISPSSARIRAVTFDCTVCNSLAALFMLPRRATVSKYFRSATSMGLATFEKWAQCSAITRPMRSCSPLSLLPIPQSRNFVSARDPTLISIVKQESRQENDHANHAFPRIFRHGDARSPGTRGRAFARSGRNRSRSVFAVIRRRWAESHHDVPRWAAAGEDEGRRHGCGDTRDPGQQVSRGNQETDDQDPRTAGAVA
ncbi:hypothetical protein D3C81_1244150 [compost metagenome]